MFLLIDTSEYNTIHLALFNKNSIEHKKYSGQNSEILSCVDKLLRGRKTSPLNKGGLGGLLAGIMVVVGAGSFTSTRLACVVANTFAYVLQIPLLAIKKSEINKIQKLIPKLLKQKKGHYISATYSGEANIGSGRGERGGEEVIPLTLFGN